MAIFEDKTNKKYGNLTVIGRAKDRRQDNGRTQVYWLCKCTCGNTVEVRSTCLNSGNTKSCGCKCNPPRHGLSHTRLYSIWVGKQDVTTKTIAGITIMVVEVLQCVTSGKMIF